MCRIYYFSRLKIPRILRRDRYSNRATSAAKITCGVLPSCDRVAANFRKHAERSDLLWPGVEINRGCTRRTRATEIETEARCTFCTDGTGPKRCPRTIHFNILFRYGSLSFPTVRLLRATSSDALVHP